MVMNEDTEAVFEERFPERSKGIRFFLDWFLQNKDNYDFNDYNLDIKLYDDYVKYWRTL